MDVGVRDNSGKFTESFEIFAKLPAGTLTSVMVQFETTVRELKSIIEFTCGIPSNLQQLSYKTHHDLQDKDTLRTLCIIPGVRIPVAFIHGYEDLMDTALAGNTKGVLNDLKKRYENCNIRSRRYAAVFVASQRGYHFLVERLLQDGVDVNRQLPTGRTPLHIACAMGNTGCVDLLLDAGASLTTKDSYGQTPIEVAANCKQKEAERRLHLLRRASGGPSADKRKGAPKRERIVSSWAWTPRFRSKSAPPAALLREMSLTPGPELVISQCKLEEITSRNKGGENSLISETESSDLIYDNKSETSDNLWKPVKNKSAEHGKENVNQVSKSSRSKAIAYDKLLRKKYIYEKDTHKSERDERNGDVNLAYQSSRSSENYTVPEDDIASYSDVSYKALQLEKSEQQRIADAVMPPAPNILRVGSMEIPRADPEDNQKAVREWLKSKNAEETHARMYKQWQSRRTDQLEKQRQQLKTASGKSRDQWMLDIQTKREREKEKAKQKFLEEEKQRQLIAEQHAINGYTFEAWCESKRVASHRTTPTYDDGRNKKQLRRERQLMAQKSFEKWMMSKQWEELCRLKEKPSSRNKTTSQMSLPSRKLH